MPIYNYTAVDPSGAVARGSIEAQDQLEGTRRLESSGHLVLEIRARSGVLWGLSHRFRSFRVKRLDMIELANNLSSVLSAGIPLLTAVEDIAATITNKVLKGALEEVKADLIGGSTLSEALRKNGHIFPDILVRLAEIGETTGRLDSAIKDAADHLERVENIAAMIKRALMYPMFALFTTGGALVFWLVFVLPSILNIMKEMQVSVPFFTRILMVMSEGVTKGWYVIVTAIVLLIIAYNVMKKKAKTKYYIDLLKINMPILKHIVYNKLLALFSEQMRILTSAGIMIDKCLEASANALNSEVFKVAIDDARERIKAGEGIANGIKSHNVFPPLVVRMVDVGEKSGNLDSQFKFLSEYFFKKLEAVTDKLSTMIEPILIGVVGGMFALIALGLLLPIYDVISKIK